MRAGAWILLGLLLGLTAGRQAQADSEYQAAATFVTESIHIDGRLDEPAWQSAPVLKGWHQTRDIGKPAREDTEVRVLYDPHNLYFGFHCLDSKPSEVKAFTVQNEGFLHQEDNVTIILDPYLDHRNAYYFWTNLLGVRTDGRIIDDGEAFTTDWKGEWEAKGRLVADGWVVEIRIPFSNFQFHDKPVQTWGMLLDREQVRLQEWSNWTPDGVNSAKVSRYPHLTGLDKVARPERLFVTPYAAAELGVPPQDTSDLHPRAGLDLRFNPGRSWSIMGTVLPDFAQVEVDEDILYLNTEERLLPERRPFFLESQQLFVSPIQMFNSRRIAAGRDDQVIAGLQAVGKVKGSGFAVMDVQTREARDDGTFENINYGLLRFQQDIGKRSNISVLGANREGDEAYRVAGVDANLHLWEEFFIQAQAAKNWNPVSTDGTSAFHLGIHRFTTNNEVWLQFEDIGANFLNPMGYIPVIDKRGVRGHIAQNWFTKKPFFNRLDLTWNGIYRVNHQWDLTRHYQQLILQPYLGRRLALYAEGLWDQNGDFLTTLGTGGVLINPNEWQGGQLTAVAGKWFGSDFAGLTAQTNFKLGPRVMTRLSVYYARATGILPGSPIDQGQDSGYQWSAYGQLRAHLTPDLYARVTYQQGAVVGMTDLNRYHGRVFDATLGWHYRPGSDAWLVFTQQPVLDTVDRRVMLKVSYQFAL